MTRQIAWSHWKNPFTLDDEYIEEDEDDETPSTPWKEEDSAIRIRTVVPTQMGIIPILPHEDFCNSFEFWVADTNFGIENKEFDIIDSTDGVEIFDVLSRYRFRVCIAKLFNAPEVKLDIQNRLGAKRFDSEVINPRDMTLDEETETKVELAKQELGREYSYWAIYLLPNGEMEARGFKNGVEYQKQFDVFKQCQDLVGGVIYRQLPCKLGV